MKILSSIEGGLAGAAALTIIHETVRRIHPDAPRMDLLGMTALSKILKNLGETPPGEKKLFYYTMAGDLAANSLYYSMAGIGHKQNVLTRGLLLGLGAGLGAVLLPKPLHLPQGPSSRTPVTTAMTMGLYLLGGVVAAFTMKLLEPAPKQQLSDYMD